MSYAEELGFQVNSLGDINNELQLSIHRLITESKKRPSLNEVRKLTTFYNSLEQHRKPFVALSLDYGAKPYKAIEAMPLTTMFQLDAVAKKELNYLMKHHSQYKEWKREYESLDLFSLENLARSYYEDVDKRGSDAGTTIAIYNRIAKKIHSTDLKAWSERRNGKCHYYKGKSREKHEELIKLSKQGTNIEIASEKMFCFWHMELIPNFPFEFEIDKKYEGVLTRRGLTAIYRNKFGKSIEQFHNAISPDIHSAYALALFMMLREGKNSEVVRSWKVELGNDSKYHLGTESPFGLIVEGIKARTNTIQRSVFHSSSEERKFIDFYLSYAEPIYRQSKSNSFFQYSIKHGKTSISEWKNGFISNLKASDSPNSLFRKHEVCDIDGNRIYSINHQSIRPAVNYSNYLKGLTEYERQCELGHKDASTQKLHYENSAEWKGRKKYRISKTQEILVNYFRGKVTRDHPREKKLFEGLFADCTDPFAPNYGGAPKIKEGEGCDSWFKCFGCTKARIIPMVHGEIMYAYILEMKKRKDEFYRLKDWEKEYLYDYLTVKAVFDDFTDEEKAHAKENAYKHSDVVKMNFKPKVKLRKV